jgi:hypothetical protein
MTALEPAFRCFPLLLEHFTQRRKFLSTIRFPFSASLYGASVCSSQPSYVTVVRCFRISITRPFLLLLQGFFAMWRMNACISARYVSSTGTDGSFRCFHQAPRPVLCPVITARVRRFPRRVLCPPHMQAKAVPLDTGLAAPDIVRNQTSAGRVIQFREKLRSFDPSPFPSRTAMTNSLKGAVASMTQVALRIQDDFPCEHTGREPAGAVPAKCFVQV